MNTNTKKFGALAVLFLVAAVSLITWNTGVPISSSAQTQTQGFDVVNSTWGTTSSPISAAPGDIGDMLTITLQYIYEVPNTATTATAIYGTLTLPSGFSGETYASVTGTNPPGATMTMSFLINVASNVTLGSYVFDLNLSWLTTGYSYYLNQTLPVTMQVLGRPQLFFSYSSSGLSAGQENTIPIKISNNGSGTASNIVITATTQTAAILNTIPVIQSLAPGSVTSAMVNVYVPASSSGSVITISLAASYKTSNGISESITQTLYTYVSTAIQPKLQVSTSIMTLTPDQVNVIPVTITNTGNATLSQISVTLAASPSTVTLLGSPPYIATLNAGSSINEQLSLYIPSTISSSSVTISISSSFVQLGGVTGTASQTLGFYTLANATSVYNTKVAVIPVNTNVTAGQQSKVTFKLENTGNSSIYNLAVAISVSSPLVVSMNSSFTFGEVLSTKGSLIYEATLTASPSSTLGTYSGTITISYTDAGGNEHSQSFTSSFALSGTIILTPESESVSQSTRTLSVSGTLLNEGTASAYYATAVGCVVQTGVNFPIFPSRTTTTTSTSSPVAGATSSSTTRSFTVTTTRSFTNFTGSFTGPSGGSPNSTTGATTESCPSTAASEYIGEIDPNSPVAYSLTANYVPANTTSRATLVMVITYKNNYGQSATQVVDKQVTLTPQTTGTSTPTIKSSNGEKYVKIGVYAVIAGVVASLVAGGLYTRRNRKITKPSEEKVV
ncbi:MAG: hypothetical protein JRN20_03190 [Nitrososphaerota archaeon]|nr:hypothetical protein [Nitrososphaerota archaeon]